MNKIIIHCVSYYLTLFNQYANKVINNRIEFIKMHCTLSYNIMLIYINLYQVRDFFSVLHKKQVCIKVANKPTSGSK